jgi:hypothetical protein
MACSKQYVKKGKARIPWWVSWLIYVTLSVVMTWPLAQHLNTRLSGNNQDLFNVYWGNWWVPKALAMGQNPYMTQYLIYPVGFDLTTFAFSPFLALLSLPVSWILPSIAAYNLTVWATIVLCCIAMDQLVRYLTHNPWAALVAGVTLGFAPCLAAERQARLNLAMVAWIPWAALLLTRLMREAKIRDAVLFAVTIGLAFLTRPQMGALVLVFCGIYFVGLTLVERKQWPKLAWRRLLVSGLLACLLLSPLFAHIVQRLSQPGAENLVREATDAPEMDLMSYVLPPPQHPLFGDWTGSIYRHHFPRNVAYRTFVGFVPILLFLYAAVSRPKEALPWALTGLSTFVLALGPELRFNGRIYQEIKLPYYAVRDLLSVIGLENPFRFNLAVMPALATLVGLACAGISTQFGRHWPLSILAALILFEYLVVPMELMTPPPHSPFYDRMAADGQDYAIVDLPLSRIAGEIHRYYQTIHHKPIVGGWDRRVPTSAFAFIERNPLLRAWKDDQPLDGELGTSLAGLSQADVRYIVLHKDQLRGGVPGLPNLLFALTPSYEDPDICVFATDARSGQGYSIVHRFGDVDLIQPSVVLSPGQTGPTLYVKVCWLLQAPAQTRDDVRGENGGADGYRLALIDPSGSIVDEKGALFPSSSQGLTCGEQTLEFTPPFLSGSYQVSIIPLSGERALGTFSQAVSVIQDEIGASFPLKGYAFPVASGAPMGILEYWVAAGDGALWVDLSWQGSSDRDQPYILSVWLSDLATGQNVDLSPERTSELEGTSQDAARMQRMPLPKDLPQGEYRLGVKIRFSGDADGNAAPEERGEAAGHRDARWSQHELLLDAPILVLPAAFKTSAVSTEGRVVVYTAALEGAPIEPQHKVDVRFGDVARLIGYSLGQQDVRMGQELDLTLYWEAINPELVAMDYKAFVHLLNAGGEIVAQHDGEPVAGRRPTHTWRRGDKIIDTHRLVWQAREYAGPATVAVGLYGVTTMERLPAYDAQGQRWPADRVVLGDITVK